MQRVVLVPGTRIPSYYLACEQAPQGTPAVGQEKEGELATTSLAFEFHLQFTCGFPSTEMSDFRQSAQRSMNVNKH